MLNNRVLVGLGIGLGINQFFDTGTNTDIFTSIPVPEQYFNRYQFYNINSNKKDIILHITVQIFSFIFQLSIFPILAVFLQKKINSKKFPVQNRCKQVTGWCLTLSYILRILFTSQFFFRNINMSAFCSIKLQ